ncbi:unnamed protein product, partial [Urochloa humidicola]
AWHCRDSCPGPVHTDISTRQSSITLPFVRTARLLWTHRGMNCSSNAHKNWATTQKEMAKYPDLYTGQSLPTECVTVYRNHQDGG